MQGPVTPVTARDAVEFLALGVMRKLKLIKYY